MTIGEGAYKRESECFTECFDKSVQGDNLALLPLLPPLHTLHKNYRAIPIRDRYIVKNTKHTALLDGEAFQFLETFERQSIPQELLETFCRLEFLSNATH